MERDPDVSELNAVFKDIERGMGVEQQDDPRKPTLQRIHQIDIQKISWWQRLFRTCPTCEVCKRTIKDAAVRFQGPFVEILPGLVIGDPRFAACLDRERCNRDRETDEAIERIETARAAHDALRSLVEAESENRLNRTVG